VTWLATPARLTPCRILSIMDLALLSKKASALRTVVFRRAAAILTARRLEGGSQKAAIELFRPSPKLGPISAKWRASGIV